MKRSLRDGAFLVAVLGVLLALAPAGCGGDDGGGVPDVCFDSKLYLNRSGGMFNPGINDDAVLNVSQIMDGPRELAAWPKDEVSWTDLTACIRSGLDGIPVEITEADPSPDPHVELVFTTTYWAGEPGTITLIPNSCDDDSEIGFLFGSALPTTARSCQVALRTYAQLVAHLSPDDDCMDFVNNGADCSEVRTFRDVEANCVDNAGQPADCRCGGTTQNTRQALIAATTCG